MQGKYSIEPTLYVGRKVSCLAFNSVLNKVFDWSSLWVVVYWDNLGSLLSQNYGMFKGKAIIWKGVLFSCVSICLLGHLFS